MGEVVYIEDDEQEDGAEDRDTPGGEKVEGKVFNLKRRRQEAHIDRDEAHSTTQLHD